MTSATAKKPKPSSTDRFRAIGALYTKSLPMFSSGDLVTVADEDHPAHSSAKLWRYARENPAMQRLMESIRKLGITKGPTASKVDEKVFVTAGNRTVMAVRYLVEDEAKDEDGKDFLDEIPVKLKIKDSISNVLAAYRADNLFAEGDDPITQALSMREALDGDDDAGVDPLGEDQVAELYQISVDRVRRLTCPDTGLVSLSEACKDAVAKREITEECGLALALCKGPKREDNMDALLAMVQGYDKRLTTAMVKNWVAYVNEHGALPDLKSEPKALPKTRNVLTLGQIKRVQESLIADKSVAESLGSLAPMQIVERVLKAMQGDGEGPLMDAVNAALAAGKPGRPKNAE